MVFTPQLPGVGGTRVMPGLPPWLSFTQGKIWHVRPKNGVDTNDGKSSRKAFKTLAAAKAAATANQNDIVLLYGESNTSADTTDYQSATLDWSKDMVHLIGISSGVPTSSRARVALLSTYATASNLFTLSANGCYIANIQFFAGVAQAQPTGCMKVTGSRNLVENCHIAGIGNDANDIANAYSLNLSAAQENVFRNCVIGLDTIGAGTAANCDLLVDTAAARNKFENCLFTRMLDHASNHPLVRLTGATAIDRYLWFKECLFLSMSVNYAIAQAGVFKLSAPLTEGFIIVENCMANSSNNSAAPKWDADDRDQICLFNSPTPAADTAGVGRQV